MSFTVWNSDPSFNKITSTYFKDLIDLSGNFIIRNGTIKSPANTIEFDDSSFNSINFTNIKVTGQQKLTYNSVIYDIGEVALRTTNFSFDPSLNTTTFSGNLTFPATSIASTSINNSSFVALTGSQVIGGSKQFNLNTRFLNGIRIDTSMLLNAGTLTITNAELMLIPNIGTLNTKTTSISYTPATVTTLITGVLQYSGTFNGWDTTNFSNAINYSKDFTSSGQSQLNTLTTNLSTTNTNITGITYTSGTSTTNIPNIIFTDKLNNISAVTFSYLANVQGDIAFSISNLQTQITTQNTNTTGITYTSGTTYIANNTSLTNVDFSGNINTFTKAQFDNAINRTNSLTVNCQDTLTSLQGKTTNISFDSSTNTTTIGGLLTLPAGTINSTSINNTSFVDLTNGQTIGGIKRFTANVRVDSAILVNAGATTISNASLGHISTLSSNAQTQLTNLGTRTTAVENKTTPITYNSFTTTLLITGVLQFSGTLNGWSTTNFSNAINYAKDLTSPAQTQINNINAVSLSANNVFTGSNTYNGALTTTNITFSGTLNSISTTVFGYLSGLTENIKTSLDSLSSRASTLETKNTGISYSGTTTTIGNTLATSTLTFSSTLNNISTTTFGYLSGVTESIKTSLDNLSSRITNVEIVGTIIMSPLSDLQTTTSNKYLICNGQAVSRTTYSALFAKFETLFGVGNGSTTFNLPNYSAIFLRGIGNQTINGVNYGNYNSTYVADQDSMQNHTHSGQSGSFLGTVNIQVSPSYRTGTGDSPNAYTFSNTGGIATGRINDNETKPVSMGIYYYVRT